MTSGSNENWRDVPWGSDTCADDFWSDPPKWVAVGNTPDEAIAALKAKNRDVNWPFADEGG